MEHNPNSDYQITEFSPEYTDQVRLIIGKVLKEIGVLPDLDGPIDDEDLFKIPDVYSVRGRFWLALKNGKVVGTVAIRDMGEDTARLNRMFVLTDYHGSGIGQDLLDKAILFAKDRGFKKVILNTHVLMTRAHHFYEKNRFTKVGREPDKFHYERLL